MTTGLDFGTCKLKFGILTDHYKKASANKVRRNFDSNSRGFNFSGIRWGKARNVRISNFYEFSLISLIESYAKNRTTTTNKFLHFCHIGFQNINEICNKTSGFPSFSHSIIIRIHFKSQPLLYSIRK